MILGTDVLLQRILAAQYVDEPISAFPVVGVILGLVSIFADTVFVFMALNLGLGGAA